MLTSGIIASISRRHMIVPSTYAPPSNLFTADSETFDNTGVWTRVNLAGVTANAGVSPTGTTTADKIIPNATDTASHELLSSVVQVTSGVQYSIYVRAKQDGYAKLRLSIFNNNYSVTYANGVYNLDDGTLGSVSQGSAFITAEANGFYKCGTTFTATSTGALELYITVNNPSGVIGATFVGDGTSGILLWGFQQNVGSPVTYQKTPV